MKTLGFVSLVTVTVVFLLGPPAAAQLPTLGLPLAALLPTFAPGDVFVSLETGQVQWWSAGGTLKGVLVGVEQGSTATGMRFDAAGNLYVAHNCAADASCSFGNTVEKFNTSGVSQGTVGSGYDCNPHALAFDAAGDMYVGQADCSGAVLKFVLGRPPTAYAVAAENRGSFWIDLAPDGCTLFYTSFGPHVKRFNVCTNMQLADFNSALLPGGATNGLRVLSDGGVLVSSGAVIARLDAAGDLVQTYSVSPGESTFWGGLDLVGDGTFWAVNQYSSNVYRFDLTTGAVRASFNTGTPSAPPTLNDVAVVQPGSVVCP